MNNFNTDEANETVVVDLSSLKGFGPPPMGTCWDLLN